MLATAERIVCIAERRGIPLIFKSSYKKANRTSARSFSSIGIDEALGILAEVRKRFGVPVLTDIHTSEEAAQAAEVVDILQIPAFLCRQTELLQAAGKTGKVVNIKKGQFLAPEDMRLAAEKVVLAGSKNVLLTERGTTFGYHNLVVDFRGLAKMAESGYPVLYDATHSLQLPGAGQGVSGGERQYVMPLARAAVAAGVDGLFFEIHPDPSKALSDSATQVALADFNGIVKQLLHLYRCLESFHPL